VSNRVVVTGIGLLTPVGIGVEPFWKALTAGRSGVGQITLFEVDRFPVKAAAEVKDFKLREFTVQRKMIKVMSRDIQLAVAAADLTMRDAGLEVGKFDPDRIGVNLGAGLINADIRELRPALVSSMRDGRFSFEEFGAHGMRELFPLWLLKYLPNMLACHISITYGCRGPSNSITAGHAAGSQAIGEAFRILQRGDADIMLAGGADSKIHPLSLARFVLLGVVATGDGDPRTLSRPFEKNRRGMVVGEGAGIFVLEELEHARRRGAKVYAELAGYGCASAGAPPENWRLAGAGVDSAMCRAMQDASISPADVDYVNANGDSTVENDRAEVLGIKAAMGDEAHRVPISSSKSVIGHTCCSAGALESAATVMTIRDGVVPPTINYDEPDPELDLDFVPGEARQCNVDYALTNNFGFGGQCTSLVFKKFRD